MATAQPAKGIDDEVNSYIDIYNETIKLLSDNVVDFNSLALRSTDPVKRNEFRAKALQASRTLDLLTSKMHAFLLGTSIVRNPTEEELAVAQKLIAELADLQADQKLAEDMADAIVDAKKKLANI
jgi:hypothetical protein